MVPPGLVAVVLCPVDRLPRRCSTAWRVARTAEEWSLEQVVGEQDALIALGYEPVDSGMPERRVP
jgi:hypothetical protein